MKSIRTIVVVCAFSLLACGADSVAPKPSQEKLKELRVAEIEAENLALKLSILELQYTKIKGEKDVADAKVAALKKDITAQSAPPAASK